MRQWIGYIALGLMLGPLLVLLTAINVFAATCASYKPSTNDNYSVGQTFTTAVAQSFTVSTDCYVTSAVGYVSLVGVRSDHAQFSIETDSGGLPSGTVLETGTTFDPGSSASYVGSTFLGTTDLAPSTTYWLVMRATGATGGSNYYAWYSNTGGTGNAFANAVPTWTSGGEGMLFEVDGGSAPPPPPAPSFATTTASVCGSNSTSTLCVYPTYLDWLYVNMWELFCLSFLPLGFFFARFKVMERGV